MHGLPILPAMAVGEPWGNGLLVGCSTGGTLATWRALQGAVGPSLAALLLLSLSFGPRDPRSGLLYWPGARTWAPCARGEGRSIDPENAWPLRKLRAGPQPTLLHGALFP